MLNSQIYRKLSETTSAHRSEDLLTSDVFGVLKYLPGKYLASVLQMLAAENGQSTEFRDALPDLIAQVDSLNVSFWPNYLNPIGIGGTRTEPDVEISGQKALLFFEAKLNSPFSPGQVERELLVAHEQAGDREFFLVLVTRSMDVGTLRFAEQSISLAEYIDAAISGYGEKPETAKKICELRTRILTVSWESILKTLLDAPARLGDTSEGSGEIAARSRTMVDDLAEVMRARRIFVFRGFSSLGELSFRFKSPNQHIFYLSEPRMTEGNHIVGNISEDINAALGFVSNLYGEMTALLRLLRKALSESKNGFRTQKMKGFELPTIGKRPAFNEPLMMTDMGFVMAIGKDTPDLYPCKTSRKTSKERSQDVASAVSGASRYLMIHAVLYDRGENAATFEPGIVAAVVGELTWRSKPEDTPNLDGKESGLKEFPVRPRSICSLAKRIGITAKTGDTISPRPDAKRPRLRGTIQGVQFWPLSRLTTERQVKSFAMSLGRMAEESLDSKRHLIEDE